MTSGRAIALLEEMAVIQAQKIARKMPVTPTPRPSSSYEQPEDMETAMSNLNSSFPPHAPPHMPENPEPAPLVQPEERMIEPRAADIVQDQAAANPTCASLEQMRRALQ